MRLFSIPFLVLSLCLSLAAQAGQKDCPSQIGADVVKQFGSAHPEMRIPGLEELDKAYIEANIEAEGYGCYIAAEGEFLRKNAKDVAFVAVMRADDKPQLIVATATAAGTWKFAKLPTFCAKIQSCYVKKQKPGRYVRSQALDEPPTRKNETEELTSFHDSILSGKQESTGIVYVHSKGRWKYVWVSD